MPEMPLEHAPGAQELKPCPANHDARFIVSCDVGDGDWRIFCRVDDCPYDIFAENKELAVKIWNGMERPSELRAEVARLTAYADKLADALPMLPADVDNLRRANAKFAQDNSILRDAIDQALFIIAGSNPEFATDALTDVELLLQKAYLNGNDNHNVPDK